METKNNLVKHAMTKDVISVTENTPVGETFQIMREHEFNGIPVVNSREENKLIGLVTDYDLISKRTAIHLPTFEKLFSDFYIAERHGAAYPDLQKAGMFTVQDIMNADPLVVNENAPLDEVVILFVEHHRVNPIPVINKDNVLVGIISRYDIVKLYAKSLGS